MPTIRRFYCDLCDFKSDDVSTWGNHLYVIGNETLSMDTDLGLCHSCNQIVAVENLEKDSYLTQYDDAHQKELRELLIEAREANPRCLHCGGKEFDIIKPTNTLRRNRNTSTPVDINLSHHDCGGNILLDEDTPNLFFSKKLPSKYYDLEGIRIKAMSGS